MPNYENHRLNTKNVDATLDDLLNYLKSTIFLEDNDYIQYLASVDIFFHCYGDSLTDIHNYTEPNLFMEKLYEDKFVNKDGNTYQINLNGIVFINNGGYKAITFAKKKKWCWDIIKFLAIALNALVLLLVAILTYNDK
ncbi:hypothetical protein [Sphingobacterium kitahiroshimense]|uniref:Uncharacterized protein n=1 Tax=Sphingobacterium kitahiroshimense TaxID=470446 RepID=A0ABV0C342_9SPHI